MCTYMNVVPQTVQFAYLGTDSKIIESKKDNAVIRKNL